MRTDQVARKLIKALNKTVDEVKEGLDKALNESAQEGVKRLKSGSPNRTGKYAAGWTTKKSTRRDRHSRIFYNKDYPGLTHLLEHGHAIKGGGRSLGGRTKAQKHIEPVEEYVIRDIESKLEGLFR